jgi:hypothetical protein
MARCACSRTCRSTSAPARPWRCSAPTATASHADEMHHGHRAPRRGPHRRRRSTAAHDLVGMPTEEIVDLGIALVPEGRRLFPKLSVEENLLLGAFRPRRARSSSATWTSASRPFRGSSRALHGSSPARMSGGEQQMLALARALMSGAAHPAGRRALGRPRAAAGRAHHRQDQGTEGSGFSSPC